jgi:hypothetical protein
MEGIYSSIAGRNALLRSDGTKRDNVAGTGEGCVAVVFRHAPEVSELLGNLSAQIGEIVPTHVYPGQQIQTTIFPCHLRPGFSVGYAELEAMKILRETVEEVLETCPEEILTGLGIDLRQMIFFNDGAMAAGWPTHENLSLGLAIADACEAKLKGTRVPFAQPWGSQAMFARYLAACPPDQLGNLYELIDDTEPPGLSVPTSIDIIANIVTKDEQFMTGTFWRFDL